MPVCQVVTTVWLYACMPGCNDGVAESVNNDTLKNLRLQLQQVRCVRASLNYMHRHNAYVALAYKTCVHGHTDVHMSTEHHGAAGQRDQHPRLDA